MASDGSFGDAIIDAYDNSLISYWNLNETSGNRADGLATGNNLTDNNTVTYDTGKSGNAAEFVSGNNEYLCITNAAQTGLGVDYDDSFSISAWIKVPSNALSQYMISKFDSAGNRGYFIGSLRNDHPSYPDKMWVALSNTWASSKIHIASSVSITTNAWVHLGLTYDGSGNASGAKLYINGSEDTSRNVLNDDLSTNTIVNTDPFQLSGYAGTNGLLDGLIDEVGFWSGAVLSSAAMSALQSKFWTPNTGSPWHYYAQQQ